MKLKKYLGDTEEETLQVINTEFGNKALILSVKKVQPRGIISLFKKDKVEITVAYDEDSEAKNKENEILEEVSFKEELKKENIKEPINLEANTINKEIEKQELDNLEKIIKSHEQTIDKLKVKLHTKDVQASVKYKDPKIEVFYKMLVKQNINPNVISYLLDDLTQLKDIDKVDINFIVKIIFNKIINILGEPDVADASNLAENKVLTFIGPTGVGKTTTIAKLSSNFILNNNIKIGLITSDTYRIAAIEQLKTYAEILNMDIKVVYDSLELVDNMVFMSRRNNMLLIDTAGRSHKNKKAMDDLSDLLQYLDDSKKYLVLSLTTKHEDLLSIIESYEKITDFSLIFTKLDETNNLGTLLNISYDTKKKISYITNGQSVPDDIIVMNPLKIAKSILGIGGLL